MRLPRQKNPAANQRSLGDGYRIEARVVVWEQSDVIKVPAGALFRDAARSGDTSDADWAVYRLSADGQAEKVLVSIGERNDQEAEVLSGLNAGDQVVLHPSDKVGPGVKLVARELCGWA